MHGPRIWIVHSFYCSDMYTVSTYIDIAIIPHIEMSTLYGLTSFRHVDYGLLMICFTLIEWHLLGYWGPGFFYWTRLGQIDYNTDFGIYATFLFFLAQQIMFI